MDKLRRFHNLFNSLSNEQKDEILESVLSMNIGGPTMSEYLEQMGTESPFKENSDPSKYSGSFSINDLIIDYSCQHQADFKRHLLYKPVVNCLQKWKIKCEIVQSVRKKVSRQKVDSKRKYHLAA